MSAYTVGDTVSIPYTFLLSTKPSDLAVCQFQVTDEAGALLTGNEPALIAKVSAMPSGRYRVRCVASVTIPDTSYDKLSVDYTLSDGPFKISGSTEIDVTVDLEQPDLVAVELFNQPITLSMTLPWLVGTQDPDVKSIKTATTPVIRLLPGQPLVVPVVMTASYTEDLELIATFLPISESGTPESQAWTEEQGALVRIPAGSTEGTLRMATANTSLDRFLTDCILTLTPPENSPVQPTRSRIEILPEEDLNVVFLTARALPVAPNDTHVRVSLASTGSQAPFDVILGVQAPAKVGLEPDVDYGVQSYKVTLSSPTALVQIPLYFSGYPPGTPVFDLRVSADSVQDVRVVTPVVAVVLQTSEVSA